MNRRKFIATSATSIALTAMPFAAFASPFVDYRPGLLTEVLGEGKTVFVDYSATWCGTCKRQERIIDALTEANPAYAQAMAFVKVDWDTYSGHKVTTSRNIPRRSTLLVLRGDQELGRIVAGTSEADIKALLDLGL